MSGAILGRHRHAANMRVEKCGIDRRALFMLPGFLIAGRRHSVVCRHLVTS